MERHGVRSLRSLRMSHTRACLEADAFALDDHYSMGKENAVLSLSQRTRLVGAGVARLSKQAEKSMH